MSTEHNTSIPPINLFRNDFGLLPNVKYSYKSNGRVDYKSLISPEHLVPNRQYFEHRNLKVPTSIDGLQDKEILVKLMGWRELADLRGYVYMKQNIESVSSSHVSVRTTIRWIGNYETGSKEVEYDGYATATLDNTFDIAQKYLGEIASNRSECRAIRGFLRIPILGFDEVGPTSEQENNSSNTNNSSSNVSNPAGPHAALEKRLIEKNKSFDSLKVRLSKDKEFIESVGLKNEEDILSFSKIDDVPGKIVVKILTWISKQG